MFVRSLYLNTNHLSVRDELLANRATLKSPSYAPTLAHIIALGNFPADTWFPRFEDAMERYLRNTAGREIDEADQTVDAEEIDDNLAEIKAWFDDADLSLIQAVANGVPGARQLQERLKRAMDGEATYRHLAGPTYRALLVLAEAGDLTRFGLLADHVARGEALNDRVNAERSELFDAQAGITANAILAERALIELADLMEAHHLCVRLASIRLGYELPQLDLRFLRAARAGRSASSAANAEPNPAAPATPVTAPVDDAGL